MSMRVVIAVLALMAAACGGSPPPPVEPPPSSETVASPSTLETSPGSAKAKPASAREALDAFEAAIKASDRESAVALVAGGLLTDVVDELLRDKVTGFAVDGPNEDPERGTCFPTEVKAAENSRAMTFCVKSIEGAYKIATVTVRATAEPAKPAAPTPPPPAADVEQSVEGKIVSRAKDKVTIQIDGTAPASGATAELYRKLDQALPFMPAGAWIGIAAVRVDKVEGNKVTLAITDRKSTITINGTQVDHFKPQTAIRLTWNAKP